MSEPWSASHNEGVTETVSQTRHEDDPTLAWICDRLVLHLQGQPDRLSRTYELLAKRLFEPLPAPVVQHLRESPEKERRALSDLLAGRLRDDPRTRQLVGVILTPAGETTRGPGHRTDGACRILFLSAQPKKMGGQSLPRLDIDEEIRQIQDALLRTRHGHRLDLVMRPAIRARDLSWYLLEYDPDILHFSGHGYPGAILVQRDDGSEWLLEGQQLARLFGIFKNRLRCVVLNACYAGQQAEPIARQVGAAVARNDRVPDQAAIVFSEHFYQGLAYGRTLQEAFKLGCWQVEAQGEWGASALPQLLGESLEIRFVSEVET